MANPFSQSQQHEGTVDLWSVSTKLGSAMPWIRLSFHYSGVITAQLHNLCCDLSIQLHPVLLWSQATSQLGSLSIMISVTYSVLWT
jgi:hypothetical protein